MSKSKGVRLKVEGNGFVIRNGSKTLGASGFEKTPGVGERPKGLGPRIFLTRVEAETFIKTELKSSGYKIIAL